MNILQRFFYFLNVAKPRPILDDNTIDLIGESSLSILKAEIKCQNTEPPFYPEEWFKRPYYIADSLADKLALAIHCLEHGYDIDYYKSISEKKREG